jgi:hypothetical protein
MPVALTINNTRAAIPNIMITNSGELRFDIYAGPFTKNDQLTASPFADSFLFIPDVPFSAAAAVLPALNSAGSENRRRNQGLQAELWARGYVEIRYREWLEEMYQRDAQRGGNERRAAGNLTLGYVTTDVRCIFFQRKMIFSSLYFRPALVLETIYRTRRSRSSHRRTLSRLRRRMSPTTCRST